MAKWRCCCGGPGDGEFTYPCGEVLRDIATTRAFCNNLDAATFGVQGLAIRSGSFWRARRILNGLIVGESVHGMIATNGVDFAALDRARSFLAQEFGLFGWPPPDVSLAGPSFNGVTTVQFIAQQGLQPFLNFQIDVPNPLAPAINIDQICMNDCEEPPDVLCGTQFGTTFFTRRDDIANPYPDADPNLTGSSGLSVQENGVEVARWDAWAHRSGLYVPPEFVSPCPGAPPPRDLPPGMPDPSAFTGMGGDANTRGCCG